MAINERLVHTASAAAAGGGTGNQEEGLILHLDANDVDSYDGDGDVWYDIKDHEYTPSTNVSEHFNTVTFGGNGVAGASTEVTGVGFEPDLVWLKVRNQAYYHRLVDSVRGVDKALRLTATSGEVSSDDYAVLSFNDDGFNYRDYGQANTDIVAWCFKAGGTPSGSDKVSIDGTSYADEAAAGLTAGTLAVDKLSANTKLGFSMVKVIDHNNTKTIAHGLDSAPEMIIQKVFDSSGYNWYVYHKDLGNDKYLNLNTTGAATADNFWDYTNPTGSVFTHRFSSTSFDMIYYCFTSKRGVSKVGAYIGNGSTNNKIYTGFEPAFVMLKNTSISNTRWIIMDNARNPDNPATKVLSPNSNNAEDTSTSYWLLDWERDGFRLKYGADNEFNRSGDTFIYYAVAKNTNETSLIPLKDEFTAGSIETTDLELDLDANSYSGSGDWLDGTSNSNNGTISGASYVNDGDSDYFSFDGTNDSVNLGGSVRKALPMSVEMWINPSSTTRGVIYSNYDTSATKGFFIRLESSLKFQIDSYNGSAGNRTLINQTGSALPLNSWSHCVFTFDTSQVKIYLNGELDTQVGTNASGIGFTSGFDTLLARRAGGDLFTGLIGQTRVYSSTLTQAQIQSNYKATRSYDWPELQLHLDADSFDGSTNTPTTWTDSSSNSNNGTITGATFDSELGNWLDFDGSDNVLLGQLTGFSNYNFSIEMWIRNNGGSSQQYITSFRYPFYVTTMFNGLSGLSGLQIYNGSSSFNVDNTAVQVIGDGKWHHFAATHDGSNLKGYVDGELVDTTATNTTTAFSYGTANRLGARADLGSSATLNGNIGQLRMYSSALTQAQIRQNFNFTKPSYPSGNDGPISGAVWDPAGYFDFDGSNDYVQLPFNTTFSEFSFHAWVRPDSTTSDYHAILGKWWDGSNRGFFLTGVNEILKVDIAYTDSNTDHLFGSTALPNGVWSFVCVTWKNYEGLTLTVNDTTETHSINKAIRSNTNSWYIGNQDSRIIKLWDGRISECRMYDKKLSAEEITSLYDSTKETYGY